MSTKEQVEEGNSLVSQEKICQQYAINNNYEVARVFIEQGESAKTTNRTELKNLLAYCSNKKNYISAVIAYKIDRISRNTDDYSYIRLALRKLSIEIKSTSEHFENNPAGRFMENIIANVAQFDNDVRTERSVGGMKEAVNEGRYVWTAPIGYINAKVGGKSTIVPSSTMAPIIRETFERISNCNGNFEEIRKQMEEFGLVNKKGNAVARSYFYKILKNELYTGWIYKFQQKKKGLFEPIISEELFMKVQWVLKKRKRRFYQYSVNNPDFPLRRFVTHQTGLKLTGSWSKGRKAKFPYYRFMCEGMNFSRDKINALFSKFLNRYQIKDDKLKIFREKLDENYIKKSKVERNEFLQDQQRIERIKDEISSLLKKHDKGLITDQILSIQSERLNDELIEANQKAINNTELIVDVLDILRSIEGYLKNPGQFWLNATYEIKMKIQWFQFPKGIVFDGQNFRTEKIASIFMLKQYFFDHLSSNVHSGSCNTNNPKIAKSTIESVDWEKIVKEIVELDNILKSSNEN